MLTRGQVLDPLVRHRTDEIVVTTMGATRPWGRISDSDLDFASADSAMGHAADPVSYTHLTLPTIYSV